MKEDHESKEGEHASSGLDPPDAGVTPAHESEEQPKQSEAPKQSEPPEEQEGFPLVRSEALFEAFQRQLSAVLAHFLGRYGKRRLSGNRKGDGDVRYRELVYDALDDTLTGKARWNFDATPLIDHVRDVIKRRTIADWARAQRFPHASIDTVTDEVERALRERSSDSRARENARAALAELRQRAADDPEVLAMISAMDHHETTSRAEIMHLTGFSEAQYRAVRRRLNLLVDELPIQVRPKRNKGE